jgi:hypothetical protein
MTDRLKSKLGGNCLLGMGIAFLMSASNPGKVQASPASLATGFGALVFSVDLMTMTLLGTSKLNKSLSLSSVLGQFSTCQIHHSAECMVTSE